MQAQPPSSLSSVSATAERKLSLFVAILVSMLLFSANASAQSKRGPSTPEERQKVVEIVTRVENEPLDPNAKDDRAAVLMWLIDVPDITVSVCTDVMPEMFGSKKQYASDIVLQATLSSAKFIIENPAKAKDAVAVNTAGIKGALKVYAAIKQQKPKTQFKTLDELQRQLESGGLEEYLKSVLPKCKT